MPETLPSRLVVSNATPIIALALIGQLDLLQKLYGQVIIPPAVEAEILAGGQRAGAIELPKSAYIQTLPLLDPSRADLLNDLDRGEAEVLALAQERRADLVIMDERLGRRHAHRLGFNLTGVLGVLLRAKQQNHLALIRPSIIQLQQGGIHLREPLIRRVLEMAGEDHDE